MQKKAEAEQRRPMNIGTQINGNIDTSGGNINTGTANDIGNSTTSGGTEKKWFRKELVKAILTFLSGIGSTLLVQYVMRCLGWIK